MVWTTESHKKTNTLSKTKIQQGSGLLLCWVHDFCETHRLQSTVVRSIHAASQRHGGMKLCQCTMFELEWMQKKGKLNFTKEKRPKRHRLSSRLWCNFCANANGFHCPLMHQVSKHTSSQDIVHNTWHDRTIKCHFSAPSKTPSAFVRKEVACCLNLFKISGSDLSAL